TATHDLISQTSRLSLETVREIGFTDGAPVHECPPVSFRLLETYPASRRIDHGGLRTEEKMTLQVLTSVFCVCLASAQVPDGSPTARVEGRVRTLDGTPVPRAIVQLVNRGTGNV